jgi:hypothetical protein
MEGGDNMTACRGLELEQFNKSLDQDDLGYIVVKAINTVKYRVDQELTQGEVQSLCNLPSWKIVIKALKK